MRGTCFIASRLAMVAVAGLLCIWWCVVGAAGFFRVFIFIFIFLRTHTACCKYEDASGVIYLSTSNSDMVASGSVFVFLLSTPGATANVFEAMSLARGNPLFLTSPNR